MPSASLQPHIIGIGGAMASKTRGCSGNIAPSLMDSIDGAKSDELFSVF